MFEGLAGAELLDLMREAQRGERTCLARELLAIGRLTIRQMAASGQDHVDWCVDYWDVVAAEIGAELGVSRGVASSWMHYGTTLIERLPKLAEVFLAGAVDFRVIRFIDFRTGLIVDEKPLAEIDEMLAHAAVGWNALSDKKVAQLVDWLVIAVDPEAVRTAKDRDANRHLEVQPGQGGMAEIYGSVRAADGVLVDARLNELAASVCAGDPRTRRQRRADALSPAIAGATAMPCLCGTADCPAAGIDYTSRVVVHVFAEAATVEGTGDKPGYVSGHGPVPAAAVREMAASAELKPIVLPKGSAEPRYRPSRALADFVRSRDLTCRWMGCDQPAWHADIDHTVPYPHGPTHPSNNDCFCRLHQLKKTFYRGAGGWNVVQQSDGTMIFTSPLGRIHTTTPFGATLFATLGEHTGELALPVPPPTSEHRGLAMPRRKRTRAQDRAYRIRRERNINAARYAADPPPF